MRRDVREAGIDDGGDRITNCGDRCLVIGVVDIEAGIARALPHGDKCIDAETGERRRFCSAILPAWVRKSPQVVQVPPLLSWHGPSSSDFGPLLEQFLGSAAGSSAPTITWLTAQWQDDAEAFNKRSLKDMNYVYVWVTGSTSRSAWSRTRCACW